MKNEMSGTDTEEHFPHKCKKKNFIQIYKNT